MAPLQASLSRVYGVHREKSYYYSYSISTRNFFTGHHNSLLLVCSGLHLSDAVYVEDSRCQIDILLVSTVGLHAAAVQRNTESHVRQNTWYEVRCS